MTSSSLIVKNPWCPPMVLFSEPSNPVISDIPPSEKNTLINTVSFSLFN